MTTIGVFSSVHGGQILEYCKWDDQKAIAAFDRFGPDIVCGEVRRSDMESSGNHYPTEYDRYIFDYCKNRNIPFVPCDYWTEEEVRLQYEEGNILEANLGPKGIEQWTDMMNEFMESGIQSEVPFNSPAFNDLARRKHDIQGRHSPETHSITWTRRNRRIVENIREVVAKNPDKKILVIFGAEHSYWFVDEFSKDDNLQVTFPL